jgi:hypothetical protein
MKTKLFISGILLAVVIGSCISPRYLPQPEEIDVNQYGSYIVILKKSNVYIKGELIAIDSNRIIVLAESERDNSTQTKIVTVSDIKCFTLRYAKPKHYGWTIPLLTLATISHGWFLVLTAPVNLITTISVTVAGESAYEYNDRKMTYDKLKMFARFPQGLPANVDVASIR